MCILNHNMNTVERGCINIDTVERICINVAVDTVQKGRISVLKHHCVRYL